MAMNLFEHNATAYQAAVTMLAERGKACVIHPTGTGKSFIGFKLCEDNPDKIICWLSPSDYIFQTQIENLAAVSGGWTPENIVFSTYAKLAYLTDDDYIQLHPDFIVLDEFHRCGADVWGHYVNRLLTLYPDVPILGLSATAIRYLDNQRDMADELFDGNVASEMTLGEAIVRGILNPPKYILSIYSYGKEFEKYEKRVHSAKSKAARDEATAYLEALRRELENAEGLDVIFDKHMTDRYGKYIVFTPNFESMQSYMDLASDWFAKVDQKPHIYSVYSDDPSASKEFIAFKEDHSEHLKLLYCIDALNEGVHVDDVAGVILLRPTISPIIYKQQIGRALSASKSKEPVIFDIVNNIENLYSIDSVKEEMRHAVILYRANHKEDRIINDSFEIYDKLAKCRELFEQLEGTLSASWEIMYAFAKAYYDKHGNIDVPKHYVTEDGYTLGSWIMTQRRVRAGLINGTLTDDQIEKLDQLGMRWESKKEAAWEKYYSAAKEYYEQNGNLSVPAVYIAPNGIKLGSWIANLRTQNKIGSNSSYLTPEKLELLNEIGMIWDVFDFAFERNYHACVAYFKQHGDLNCRADYVSEDGIKIGLWLNTLRQNRKNNKLTLTDEQIRLLDVIGMQWLNKHETAWNQTYIELCRYYQEHGHTDIPAAYRQNGIGLGKWIRRQRELYHKGKLSAERIAQLEQIGVSFDMIDTWEEKFLLAQEYYNKNGSIRIPPDYVVNGVWLNKWLNEQKLIGEGKRKKKLTAEQREKLESIGLVFGEVTVDRIWEERYSEAKSYYEAHGDLNIPPDYQDSQGKKLKRWLARQKKCFQDGLMPDDKIWKLEAIGMDFSSRKQTAFENGYEHLRNYVAEYGDADVSRRYVCADGFRLGIWVVNHRRLKNNLSDQEFVLLDALGMIWNVSEYQWRQMYQYAEEYYKVYGNLTVPQGYCVPNGKSLYEWVLTQRRRYQDGKLSTEQIELLKKIDFRFEALYRKKSSLSNFADPI